MIRNRLLRHLTRSCWERQPRGVIARSLDTKNLSRSFHSTTPPSTSFELGRNPGLESVISQGLSSLEGTAKEIQSKTRHSGIVPSKSSDPSIPDATTHRQMAEAQRLLDVATECLDDLCHKYQDQPPSAMQKALPGLQLKGQPIELFEVQVNKDGKQAKVFWTLPYSVLLDPNVNQNIYQRLVQTLQEQLLGIDGQQPQQQQQQQRGGAKILSQHVGSKLRFYFPPRIKLVPATQEMVERAIREIYD
ncbi:unnamed protein product [Cylindrotheca closterium]|uniref:Uncharacterized protein n=1 Tax=Cylindrotheca closterium TaxID=2856 RepID=A0AAD2PWK6_9STRA|nr:unnamed protein product [Cylindrotheca closterium]